MHIIYIMYKYTGRYDNQRDYFIIKMYKRKNIETNISKILFFILKAKSMPIAQLKRI